MQIILSASSNDGIVGREYVDNELEGEFALTVDGAVVYRHSRTGELFTNASLRDFVACVRAWEQYQADVQSAKGEAAELGVVGELRRMLDVHNAACAQSFWEAILLQAEWGLL